VSGIFSKEVPYGTKVSMIGSPESDLYRSMNFLVKLLLGPKGTKKERASHLVQGLS
jgi:hypothetical protein